MSKVKGLQVYDNFLSDQYLNHLKDVFMWSQMIDWKVNLSSRGEREELEKKIFDTQMVCELIKTPYFISSHTKFLCPFLDIMPWTYRAKVNVTFPSEKEPYYLGHHTDQPELDSDVEKIGLKKEKLAVKNNSNNVDALFELAFVADSYYEDKKMVLRYYERFLERFESKSPKLTKYASERIKQLRKKLFIEGVIVD